MIMTMKKIFSLIAISLSIIAGFSACGEEDATYTPTVSNIAILKADVNFDCLGGEGVIEYSSKSNVTFSCDSAWVTLAQTQPGTIAVTVGKNYSNLDGRIALVHLSDGNGVKDVVVLQQGITENYSLQPTIKGQVSTAVVEDQEFPALWINSNKAATFAYGCKALEKVEVLEKEDWFDVEFANDSMYVTVQANTTGHLRQGSLAYECGALRDELFITQYDEDENINGYAFLVYTAYVNKDFVDSILVVKVTPNGIEIPGSSEIAEDGKDWVIPMTHKANTLNYSLSNKSYVGDYAGAYDVNLVALNANGASTYANVTYTTIPLFDEENGMTYMPVTLNPSWFGFFFNAFKKGDAVTADNNVGPTGDYFLEPTLFILPAGAEASALRKVDVAKLARKKPIKK